ncbi:MAG: Endoribonuclease [Bryobacterales bacterium]|nr:Endoribonuclease [Bryobacterales bacterium]
MRRNIALLLCPSILGALLAVGFAWGQSTRPWPPRIKAPKKEREPETQTLPLPPEPPAAVVAETGKLTFHVSPLSTKGLLTQQVRDALKALDRANGDATFIKLRAFVAGTGDMRRVATIVSEEFSDKKTPLPVVTTIQVGALPMEGAQVVIESISVDKKTLNPDGLAFFSTQPAPEGRRAVTQLAAAAMSAGARVLEATCFVSGLDQVEGARAAAGGAFPMAAVNFVQLTRLAAKPEAACEGVGRLQQPRKTPVEFLDVAGLEPNAGRAHVAMVSKPKLVFTGTQMAFQDREQDLRLAYGRLGRALEGVRAHYADSLVMSVYSLNQATADRAAGLAPEFLGRLSRPAGSSQIVEGLPSLDATVAIELVAVGP